MSRIRTGHTPDAWKELGPAHASDSARISGCAVIGVSAAEQERRASRAYKAREFGKVKPVSDNQLAGTFEA
jgi:hypothetical protein